MSDYWRDAKDHKRAAARRIGKTECRCGRMVWNNQPTCYGCDTVNLGYEPPKKAAGRAALEGKSHV